MSKPSTHAAEYLVENSQTIEQLSAQANAYASMTKMPWLEVKPGVQAKTLYRSNDGMTRTLLVRIEAGAYSPPHAHSELEQVYVIEGEFHDGEKLLRAGDACVRPPGLVHSASTECGALALVVYTPAPGP